MSHQNHVHSTNTTMALQVTARLVLQIQDIVLLEALVCLIVSVSKDMLVLHSMVSHVQLGHVKSWRLHKTALSLVRATLYMSQYAESNAMKAMNYRAAKRGSAS